MDDTDILRTAEMLGYVCELSDPDGYDFDEYGLEKVIKIGGVRVNVAMKIDLFAKTCSDVVVSYKYRKSKAEKIRAAIDGCSKAIERDLAAFRGEGYTVKA